MTPAAPAWADVEAFLAADGWRQVPTRAGRRQRHIFYEKVLEDGRVLQTHVSHSRGKTISPGSLSSILRNQLEVSKTEFWNCVQTRQAIDRAVAVDQGPAEHEAWVVAVLVRDLHMTAEEIGALTPEEAQQIVHDYWSRSE